MDDKAQTLIIWFLILLTPISAGVWSYVLRKRDERAADYYRMFIRPRAERAQAFGIPNERIYELYLEAINSVVDPTIVGGAPGAIFDTLIDEEIEKQSKQ